MPTTKAVKKEIAIRILSPGWRADADFFLNDLPIRKTTTAFLGLLPSHRPELKWRAVASLGAVTAVQTEAKPEAGREIMRRLVWAMNEESGAVGLGVCEGMGEIMAGSELLAREFANILTSYVTPCDNQILFEPLVAGALWGLWRLAGARPELVGQRCMPTVISPYLESPSLEIWAFAAALLPLWGEPRPKQRLDEPFPDPGLTYWGGARVALALTPAEIPAINPA